MDSEFYQKEILGNLLVPYVRRHFPAGHRLMQDNDPKHCSKSTQTYMKDSGINWWATPPESPDLNPIENVWHGMKSYLRATAKPCTKEELLNGIRQYWNGLTAESCTTYINHIYKVLPVVVQRYGAASGY
jgi:hypothetical protein